MDNPSCRSPCDSNINFRRLFPLQKAKTEKIEKNIDPPLKLSRKRTGMIFDILIIIYNENNR